MRVLHPHNWSGWVRATGAHVGISVFWRVLVWAKKVALTCRNAQASEEVMKVLVCGGRDFNDSLTLGSWLGGIHKNNGPITLLIEGGARGADFMARKFAEWQNIPVKTFPADWDKHGKAAGPIRNKQMLDDGKPDLVVAFEGGRGTANMVEQAKRAGVRVLIADKIVVQ